jgi:hypothetical protein
MIAAADFFAVEVWTCFGLIRLLVLFVIEIVTRKVHVAGINRSGDGVWMEQVGRNLVDAEEGFLQKAQYLIHYRDPLLSAQF